jgi:hypothetical protein
MAALAAIASLFSGGAASAGCYSCGCAPVVYSYRYVSPCAVYAPPMFVVNQGPAYTLPVPIAAEPTPYYDPRPYRYVGRYAPYASEYEDDYPAVRRTWRPRYGIVPGYEGPRFRRHFGPYVGPRGIHRHGYRHRHMSYMPSPRIRVPHAVRPMMHRGPLMHRPHRGPAPGVVTPHAGPKKKQP